MIHLKGIRKSYKTEFTNLEVLKGIDLHIEKGDFVLKTRFGLPTEEGASEGITTSAEDCIFWFGDGAYFHPDTPECLFVVGNEYNLWDRHEIWQAV